MIVCVIMRIVKQPQSLNVENCDIDRSSSSSSKPPLPRHSSLLPSIIRCLISGPSGCGKTNVIVALIEQPNGLRFENVNIYSKSLYQPKYVYLERLLKPIKGITYNTYGSSEDIITPTKAKRNTVFIFDDIACDKQDVMREYFCMGRHNFIDCFYLCQTYARIPKQLIRDNANLIILFRQDDMNLRHAYTDHVVTDMTYDKFKNICSYCWHDNYGFLLINKECSLNNGRYRKGFDKFILLDDDDDDKK